MSKAIVGVWRVLIGILVAGSSAGCAAGIERLNGFTPRLSQTSVALHGHALTVRLSATAGHSGPLLVYATGDGGWFGKDKEIFNKLAPWGHPVAGFSAREYIHHLGPETHRLETDRIAEDFSAVIDRALAALDLAPDTRVVLVGKSRGAGLDVAAALSPRLQRRLQGVLAVGLTREEEYATTAPEAPGAAERMLLLYDVLPAIPVPVVVIQSTHDEYVPAARARIWFGPDSSTRRLIAIEAADHNFGGARETLYDQLHQTLDWLCGTHVVAGSVHFD